MNPSWAVEQRHGLTVCHRVEHGSIDGQGRCRNQTHPAGTLAPLIGLRRHPSPTAEPAQPFAMPRAMPQRFRVLITAGPTHEPIDAVRFIGNRSSGKLGLALCAETARRGWQTTLLLGPGTVEPAHHPHQTVLRFRTTDELQRLLRELWPQHDAHQTTSVTATSSASASS